MKLSKSIIIPVVGVAVVGAALYGPSRASADNTTVKPKSLVQEIADAFHLDKTKVQAVVDQHRGEGRAFHESKYEDRLAQAVTDGKLTAAQKEAVLAEHKKLEAEMKAAHSQDTKADKKAAIEKVHQEALDWAKQNNIEAKWLMFGGPGHGHGMGMHGGMGIQGSGPAQDQ